MRYKVILTLCLLISFLSPANSQELVGTITGTVVSRNGREPIENALVQIYSQGQEIWRTKTDVAGRFWIVNVENGNYMLSFSANEYAPSTVNVVVEGYEKDLRFVSLLPLGVSQEADESNFTELDMDGAGYNDNPSVLFGSNDPYNSIVGFGFSAIRYQNRGFNTKTQDVYLAGVKLNDAITGNTPFSLWSGLNEAARSKDNSIGLETADYGIGGFNGSTNIHMVPESVRSGWRFSVLSNSALYRLRLMASYASGPLDNGWSYAFNASVRAGGNDWIEGVYYRNFAFYGGVQKKIDSQNSLSLIAFVTPGQRGAQNASTQEVYDLMGDNMYNSNWGYQNGKVRNARVRKTFEPVVALKYDYKPSETFSATAAVVYRTGWNGYTALDWYDAMDPRPDYYRNLPSYSYIEDEDYNRANDEKAAWATEMWNPAVSSYSNYQHINWDRLYNVNMNTPDGRSKYVVEERHVDQNDLNFAGYTNWSPSENFRLDAGLNLRWNRTDNYKKVADLLGGEYYLNVDQFAERDFASDESKIQNDLDYYLAHGTAEKITKGQKYGYDYLAQVRKAEAWANGKYTVGNFSANLAGKIGRESFWREGLMRKGLFPETSLGKSEKSSFLTYSGKLGLQYLVVGGHRIAVNAGYFNDAPTFDQAFISARTRNDLVQNLTTVKTFSTDVTYQYSNYGYNARITGYFTKIKDQTDLMSFYDDSQNSFTNFAMTGIDQRHMGIEFGAKVPAFIEGLTLSAVLSLGEHIYTSNPHMVQSIDNSAEIVREAEVPYWQSHPVFKVWKVEDGVTYYDQDANGYIVDHYEKHYVPSSPQLATELALNYRTNSYWFFELNGQYFAHSYLDMNPLYRTSFACSGGDGIETPAEIEYMAAQEEFNPAFLLNCSIGKSWYIKRVYNFGFSLQVNNMLNNTNVKTGGYEQTRVIKSAGKDRYYRFDPKYFYMPGANYMLNIYFRF